MNRYEVWAPWFVAVTGFGMMGVGLICMAMAWGHYEDAESQVAEFRGNATAAFVELDACADDLEKLQGVMFGPHVPRVIAPTPEIPFFGRGG